MQEETIDNLTKLVIRAVEDNRINDFIKIQNKVYENYSAYQLCHLKGAYEEYVSEIYKQYEKE